MEFRILGPLEVVGDGGARLPIPSKGKRASLLAALLVQRNHVVPARTLIGWLWGDEAPDGAAVTLQKHVSRLRAAVIGTRSGQQLLLTRASGYELEVPPDALDALRFERLIATARGVPVTDHEARSSSLRTALSLWRGVALQGFEEEPFATAENLRLEEMRLAAVEDLMEAEMALGRHVAIIAELRSHVADHPTSERLTGQLMRVLYHAGRQAEALESLQKLRRRLLDEHGIEPGRELRQLERAVLRQELDDPPGRVPEERWSRFRGRPTAVSPVPPGLTPFVGREAERAALCAMLEQALAGQGGLVTVGGEPGVGKTRLGEEIAAEGLRRGFRVFTGHCYEAQADLPYMPWVEIVESAARETTPALLRELLGDSAPELARVITELRRLFPDIPPPIELPPDQQRRYTFNSIREYVTRVARLRPQLYVLEDLHWADEGTLLLLEHLGERLHTIPVLVIGTYRDPPIEVSRILAETLSALVRRRQARLLTLRRHSEVEVTEMLRALSGNEPPAAVTAAIYAETEGNAFFVEEVFHHLADVGRLLDERGRFRTDLSMDELDVPENVRLVTGRRLDRLGEATHRLLLIAAVSGRRSSFQLLEAVAELTGDALLDALEEAEQARVMFTESSARETHYWFGHELIRQTLLARLSPPRRKQYHLRIADGLERLHADDLERRAADIAHHLVQAGEVADGERTARYLTLAGERSLGAAAFEDALRHFDRALAILPGQPSRERADLLSRVGLAQRSLCRWQDAVATWDEAVAVLEALRNLSSSARHMTSEITELPSRRLAG